MAVPIKKETKEEIVDKIRNKGLSCAAASTQYKVNVKTIYGWLKNGIGDVSTLEMNRLRKENEQLYRIIGELTHELKTQKK